MIWLISRSGLKLLPLFSVGRAAGAAGAASGAAAASARVLTVRMRRMGAAATGAEALRCWTAVNG